MKGSGRINLEEFKKHCVHVGGGEGVRLEEEERQSANSQKRNVHTLASWGSLGKKATYLLLLSSV